MERNDVKPVAIALGFLLITVLIHSVSAGHITFRWLGWNVFLAFIPWAVSILAVQQFQRKRLVFASMLALLWLLFFPNAPYIVTDLVHMPEAHERHWWFDQIVMFSAAMVGLMLARYSWQRMKWMLERSMNIRVATVLSYGVLYLTAFGVYLGRFARWNSWDVVADPTMLVMDVAHRFIYPTLHLRTWGFTLVFGSMLAIGAWIMERQTKRNAYENGDNTDRTNSYAV